MFEQQLIESRLQMGDGKRWLSLPTSMVIHAAVVGLAVGATLYAVDDLPEPPIPVSLYVAAPVPVVPRGRPDGPKTPRVKPPEPPKQQHQLVAPRELPKEVPQPLEHEQAPEPGSNGSGGVDGAPIGWDGDGDSGPLGPLSNGPAVEATAAEPTIIRVGGEIREPRRLVEVKPVYPEAARRAHLEGAVILEVIVDTEGNVRDLRVLRGLMLGMTEAAEDAVRRWRWEPAKLNGRPVEVYITVTVIFRLR